MANLQYGGIEFNEHAGRGLVPQFSRGGDRQRSLTVTVELSSRADYEDLLSMISVVRWRRALGSTVWTPRKEAGHGTDTLVVLSSGLGASTRATYDAAYLTKVEAQGYVGHQGRYVCTLQFEHS